MAPVEPALLRRAQILILASRLVELWVRDVVPPSTIYCVVGSSDERGYCRKRFWALYPWGIQICVVDSALEQNPMTTKEHRTFTSELRKMGTYEVRQNTYKSFQIDAAKRTIAVTELERRRQARAPDTIKAPKSRRMVILITVVIAAAAVAYWKFT